MAHVQPQFEQFHKTIRLGRFEEEQTLREKRDIIRKRLDERLPEVFEGHGEDCPKYTYRDQGSYEMRTGIKPLHGEDIDIDQGIYFQTATSNWKPVVLKQRVHEALVGHTDAVRIRKPCVTTFYASGYHVDMSVYSDGESNWDGKSRLARGRTTSPEEERVWEVSDPEGMTSALMAGIDEAAAAQYRHCVRYLKRWKDENFDRVGRNRPIGIGLTICARNDYSWTPASLLSQQPDDLAALRKIVHGMLNHFMPVWDQWAGRYYRRLEARVPVEPWDDVFLRMIGPQMETFEIRLKDLLDALDDARDDADPRSACLTLQGVFGKDFPVPDARETASVQRRAVASSSNSA